MGDKIKNAILKAISFVIISLMGVFVIGILVMVIAGIFAGIKFFIGI